MYLDIDTYLDNLAENNPASSDISNIRIIQYIYPEVKAFLHLGNVYLCSPEFNLFADKVELTYDEDFLCASVYTLEKGVRVYADPPVIIIGERVKQGFGDLPDADWQRRAEELGWGKELIKEIADHFDRHPPVLW